VAGSQWPVAADPMAKVTSALAALACALVLAACGQDDGVAELIFLDIGQGDAIVIRSPEGKVALVDAGPTGTDLVSQLREHEIDSIHVAIATHPHEDHIGEMASVLRAFPVGYYLDNRDALSEPAYERLARALSEADVAQLELSERILDLGSVKLRVLPPPDTASNINNLSIGLLVEFGSFRALLTGDSQIEELDYFLNRGVPEVHVLKAAHHGANDAVTPEWLAATKPEVVVISVGADNPYGRPEPRALSYFEAATSRVYRTDQHGGITVKARRSGEYVVVTGGPGEGD
jgi:beta-lactamase superfamily II metal-dependent hydrolase